MHQTINYSALPDGERQQKAISDIVDYLGQDKMDKINEELRKNPVTRKNFIFQLAMFVGIEGYPAEVWADHLGLK